MLRKSFIAGILIAILAQSSNATNYYVRKSGNDSNDGLTPATAWKTVTKAANYALLPGDTVFIGRGIYNEQLIPSRSGAAGAPIVYYGDYRGEKTQDPPGRVAIGGCCDGSAQFIPQSGTINGFVFTLENIYDNGDGTSTIQIRVQNNQPYGLSYVAFSLPSKVTALTPEDGEIYTSPNNIRYSVENPTKNPFYCIKFETIDEGVKNGASDVFRYTLTTDQVDDLTQITMEAKASWITGTLTLPVVFKPVTCNSYSIVCQVSSKSNLTFWGITFQCASDKAVYLYNTSNIVIEDCDTRSATYYGIYATGSSTTGFLTIKADSIYGGASAGIAVSSTSTSLILSIENNYLTDCGKGILVQSTPVVNINNNVINSSSNHALYVYQTKGVIESISYNQISNVNGGSGMYLYRSSINLIDNNQITNTSWHGIYIYANSTSYSIGSITNNQINSVYNSCDGMYINRINCDRIANNLVYSTHSDGIYYNASSTYTLGAVDSNMIYDCTVSGVYVSGAMPFKSISGNTIYNVQNGLNLVGSNYFNVEAFNCNRIFSFSQRGIYCYYLQNTILENNLVYNCTSPGGNLATFGIRIYNNTEKTVNVKNNTVYQAGYYGIYGRYVNGDWRNNIVVGSTYGYYGVLSHIAPTYNCAFNNGQNYYGMTPGVGSKTDNPLFVDPDGSDNVLGGDNWLDDDFHLKSTGGSYHFGQWLFDDEDSPCVDAGNPTDDYSLEPEDNGDRINMGCYGNTPEASKKRRDCPVTAVYRNFPSNKWVMLGIPVEPWEGTPHGEPMAIFGDDLGTNTPGDWYLIHWVTSDSVEEYYEYNDGTIYQPPTPYPGIGYFLWQNKYPQVDIDVVGCPVDHCQLEVAQAPYVDWQSRYGTALGFNQFANPYEYRIDWSDCEIWKYPNRNWNDNEKEVYSLSTAASNGWISQYAYIWNHDLEQYEVVAPIAQIHSDTITVWQGFYFIQIDSVSNLKLNIPRSAIHMLSKPSVVARELAQLGAKYRYRSGSVSPEWKWFLKLGAVIPDLKLHDTENGIGVSDFAKDGFDGWDAFDLRGMNSQGNFVQLEFVHNSGPTFAYDLHADFDQSSTWKFRLNTTKASLKKQGSIVWPHIRLVPENIQFSLLDSDSATVLVPDLRAASSYNYQIKDSSHVFFIRATKVSDNKAPAFNFVFNHNPLLPNDLTFYIVPSEPLQSISATINDAPVNLTEVDSPPYIYYGKSYLEGSGSLRLTVHGNDAAGNAGQGNAAIQYQLARSNALSKLSDMTKGVALTIPIGALRENTMICLTRCAMDLNLLENATAFSEPIYIGPEGLNFQQPITLELRTLPADTPAMLYKFTDGTWLRIGPAAPEMKIASTGLYQLFIEGNLTAETPIVPLRYALEDCYPNPFNNTTVISYALQQFSKVHLVIYDLLGREIRELVNGYQPSGYHQSVWDGRNNRGELVASGIYYLEMKVGDGKDLVYKQVKKITMIK